MMLQHSAHGVGGTIVWLWYCGAWATASSSGSLVVAPWMIAPGLACAAASTFSSQSSGGRQSSSVNAMIGARARRSAALRLAPGGADPGGSVAWRSVPRCASGWLRSSSSVSGPLESWPTTISQRSSGSVCSSSALSSQRRRRGRSWDGTTTAISGERLTARGLCRSAVPARRTRDGWYGPPLRARCRGRRPQAAPEGRPPSTYEDARVTPELSIVVATRDRAPRLRELLDSLERQTLSRDRFELVIVDDASR